MKDGRRDSLLFCQAVLQVRPARLLQRRALLALALAALLVWLASRRLAPAPPPAAQRGFVIHVWRHGERLRRRFLRSYGARERDPFALCSVRNCALSLNDSARADALLVHLHQTAGPHDLPRERPPHQVWVFFTDESPLHTFLVTRKYSMRDYDGLFNWSMTYSSRSDVPVPYGRTVELSAAERIANLGAPVDVARAKRRGVAILGSNCGSRNGRWEYVRELQRYLPVDVYGACGNRTCPGHFTRDCDAINDYKFYLAFENSNCDEYLTEKLWWNAFQKGALPVVMGAPRADYERLCPPHSFLHVDDFESPRHLAAHLRKLMADDEAYNAYHRWRRRYKVVNEHGYFGSPSLHLCRLCEALNRGGPPQTYTDLASFWDPEKQCHRSWR